MAKQKKSGCGIFILTMAVLILLGGAGVFSYESYKKQQEKIIKEIGELPAFDAETAEKEVAAELHLQLPVKAPSMTEEQIKAKAEEELKALAKKKIPASLLALKTGDILKKYRPVKKGEKVSFLIMTTGKTIKGTFKGTGADNKGKYIKVEYDKYRLYDIDEEQLFLFDAVLSRRRAAEEIAGLKREFKEKRKKAIDANREKVQEKLFLKAGYRKLDDEWRPNATVLAEQIKDKDKEHQRSQKKEIRGIFEDNKLFGVIDVKLPKKNGKIEESEEEE